MALFVNPVSVARTFTTLSGRTVYVMNGLANFDLDALVAACHDKSCAPPPVGTGGSKPQGALPNGADPDKVAERLLSDHNGLATHPTLIRRGPRGDVLTEWSNFPREDPVVRVRVPSIELHNILEQGLLTQHETGMSHGYFDPDLRDSEEAKMFGAEKTRPVYGYIGGKGVPAPDTALINAYGEVVIELKDSVLDRTTMTIGDSLVPDAPTVVPVRVNDAITLLEKGDNKSLARLGLAVTPSSVRYLEAQIHGPVKPEDFARIYASSDEQYVIDRLNILKRELGLKFEIIIQDQRTMDEWACEAHGEFACHDKSCAPPPVGTGGSNKGTSSSLVNTEHYAEHLIAAERKFFGEKDQRLSEELWENYPERPVVRIRIPWTVLRDIHDAGGKFLTQHDTGTSQGILDPHLRTRKERQMFGEHEGHPIYGYIGNEEGAAPFSKRESWSRLACYGEIGLELKPEVHDRTTVVIGDSLDGRAAPIPMREIRNASPIRRAVGVQFSSREFEYQPRTVPYIEAQVHGGLSMADVRRIIVPSVDIARHVERMFPDIEVVFDREISSSDPTNFSVCDLHGEFACHDKSCAPPPVGTGGSKPQGALPNGADPDIRAHQLIEDGKWPVNDTYVRGNWSRYPSNAVVRIRVPSPLTLKKIVDQGFKSQHETGTSRGMFDPSQRDKAEQNMFSAEKTRPIYGYIADAGTETELGANTSAWVSSYGSIVVELRQSANDRTTVTMGDSLFDAVSGNIAPLRMSDVRDASSKRKAVATGTSSRFRISEHYVEAQVHGAVTAADIKRVYVKRLDSDAVKEVLKDYPDIEVVEVSDTDIYGLSTVTVGFVSGQLLASCDLHGEFACHDKSCAPPPVGTGGSKPQGALPNGADPDKVAERLLSDHNGLSSGYLLRYKVPIENVLREWSPFPGEDSVVRVRIMSSYLREILEQGLLTQHETGTSEGYFNPDLRDREEARMFGAEKTRPVYGYIGRKGFQAPQASEVDSYGDLVIELKDSVRDRTTMTIGDSLVPHAPIAPVRVNDAITLLEKGDDKSLARLGLAVTPSPVRYLEAQIHGPVKPEDFARIHVASQPKYVVDNLKALKRELGLKFEIVIQDRRTMDEWACDLHGEFACHDKSCAPPPVGTNGFELCDSIAP